MSPIVATATGALMALTVIVGVVLAWKLRIADRGPATAASAPTVTVTVTVSAPAEPPVAPLPVASTPSAPTRHAKAAPTPSATSSAVPSVAPGPALTKEQWGKAVVANASAKTRYCMEQDLNRDPNAPKAYRVAMTIEQNQLADNGRTEFTPRPSKGFFVCARAELNYAFAYTTLHPSPPLTEPFSFTTSIAFPDAKPAAKADLGQGWD
jgi:hypothetical protein